MKPAIVFKNHWSIITIGILLVLLVLETRFFISSFHADYAQGVLRPDYHHHQRLPLVTSVGQSTPAVNVIQPWMTFDYVNVVYNVPSSYLKNILGINNPKYPNIRIDRYAKAVNMNQALLLQTIRQYISSYKLQ